MLRTAICDLFEITYPVFQGGMAHIGTCELVSAVSNAGGLGIIGAGFYEPEWVRDQIINTRQRTSRPFGVNIQMASPHFHQILEVVLEERPPIVTTGAGNPANYIHEFKSAGIKVIPVVNTAEHAVDMEAVGADAVIAEGTESGGHVGETTTIVLVPEVVDAVSIPVIAAGGIMDGRSMAAVLALGALGVQMGTRFVCSTECIAHIAFKRQILQSGSPATVVTRQSLGYPLRTLKNDLTTRFIELEKAGVPVEELALFDSGRMYLGLIEGNLEEGSLLAGQAASRITEISPVRDIIERITTEAEGVISSLNNYTAES